VFRGFDHAAMAKEIAASRGCDLMVVDNSDAGPGDLALPKGDPATLAPFPEGRVGDDDMRWIYYSSGTTAAPKGARHTDASVMAGSNGTAEHVGFTEDDVFPLAFPITHIGGHTTLTGQLRSGMRIFLVEVFDPVRSPLVMAAQGATLLGSAVPFFLAYLEAQRVHGSEKLFPNLRACPSGGAPSPPELHYTLKRELGGVGTVQGWGLTEFPVASTAKVDMTDDELALTNGPLSRGVTIRVVTIEGREVGRGEEGELRLDGPQKLLGYVDPVLDDDAFDELGYFRTGDLGIVDAKGNVTITGRLKDIIIRNAENISAVEVENAVFSHAAVSDVGVIGLPDPRTGERAVAVVVLNEGFEGLTLKDLADHCRAQGLATQKIPEQLELVEVLPRSPQGKLLKHKIRDLVVNGDTTPAGGR
jgi:acyl-CoA synthetase (AMP-forming)/AMP-acid ligase II